MKDVPAGVPSVTETVKNYLSALNDAGFSGEVTSDLADRVSCSTDNSIYQIMPQAVIYPFDGDDLLLAVQVAQRADFFSVVFLPRGGGTSTNGQSLGDGVVVDTSRHMRRIHEYDPETGVVRVEPGLVRDKLIDFLAPHGQFFAPHVSTTSRATIGGMVSNDSSGKGSVVYGKTSDHIHSIELVLPNGNVATFDAKRAVSDNDVTQAADRICRDVEKILAPHFKEIEQRFPKMNRGFTGYNLKEVRAGDGVLNLPKLLAGSEGTLGFIKSVTLKSEPIPAHTALAVLVYDSHDTGLRAVPDLLEARPHAIEFIDDKILGAALRSPFAKDVRQVLGITNEGGAFAAHFFEMSDEDEQELERRLASLEEHLNSRIDSTLRPIGIKILRSPDDIARVWEIRRACQGLLAGFDKNKRAVAFIEDCAVPPENLADFVAELEAVLEARNIPLGMYGHADVGCVHIRPLMNLTAEDERRQIRQISDVVFALTQKYGGLLWGEHGKGLRGEYSEQVIGSELVHVMRQIKTLFDPLNRMNPGKIARPIDDQNPILALDEVPMRGAFDAQIEPDLAAQYSNVLRCDGNGACFNQDAAQPFCPSYKITGDRRLSPKGRASMLREWARARSTGEVASAHNIAEELNEVLETCLACKACAGAGCPAKVDIPEMKSQFLDWYHEDRKRPVADLLVANLERVAPLLDRIGGLVNTLQSTALVRWSMVRGFGLVDLPKLRHRRSFLNQLQKLNVQTMSAATLLEMRDAERAGTVVIVQDCFTSFYDADVVLAQVELVKRLGFTPVLLNYRAGGKPLHVRGMLGRFRQMAQQNAHDLAELSNAGFSLIGVDAATTLMYRHEYLETLPDCPDLGVQLLSEWLGAQDLPLLDGDISYTMIQHCTERSLEPQTSSQWQSVFERSSLSVNLVKAGCCGMSGLFGHEVRHQKMSRALYDENWRAVVEAEAEGGLVATGYSCRSQVKRLSGVQALHPAQILLGHLRNR